MNKINSKILKVDEILITYEPSDVEKERICGHTFEAFEYYLFLKDQNLPVKILFQEKIKKEKIYKAFLDKYDVQGINYKQDFIFNFNLNKIFAPIIINTSGVYGEQYRSKYLTKHFIQNICNPKIELNECLKPHDILLYDKRIYKNISDNKKIKSIKFHYVKKFYFKRYKKIKQADNKVLIYLNSFLRYLDEKMLKNYQEKYKNVLFISGSKIDPDIFKKYNILYAPIDNLFSKFDTYLYTPTTRRFDCSPRLLTEAYFYNKKILFDFNFEEYAKPDSGDTGLYWRWYDIQNNFKSLYLNENDLILKIIKGFV